MQRTLQVLEGKRGKKTEKKGEKKKQEKSFKKKSHQDIVGGVGTTARDTTRRWGLWSGTQAHLHLLGLVTTSCTPSGSRPSPPWDCGPQGNPSWAEWLGPASSSFIHGNHLTALQNAKAGLPCEPRNGQLQSGGPDARWLIRMCLPAENLCFSQSLRIHSPMCA